MAEGDEEPESGARGEAADVAVQIELGRAQLEHVAEHRDGAPLVAHEMREGEERRLRALRIRVVAIVDEERAVRQGHGTHPASRSARVSESPHDLVGIETER